MLKSLYDIKEKYTSVTGLSDYGSDEALKYISIELILDVITHLKHPNDKISPSDLFSTFQISIDLNY